MLDTGILIYEWTPPDVARIAASIAETDRHNRDGLEVLYRLLHSPKMKFVWKELLFKNGTAGGFLHPAIGGALSAFGPEFAQQRACGRIFNVAYCAARDRIAASKDAENTAAKKGIFDDLAAHRKTADELAKFALVDPHASVAAAATLRLAMVKEEQIRRIISQMRNGDDPLTIQNERGSRMIRGVLTIISAEVQSLFGESLLGTCRTLAEVALSQDVTKQESRTAAIAIANYRL